MFEIIEIDKEGDCNSKDANKDQNLEADGALENDDMSEDNLDRVSLEDNDGKEIRS